jgi:hypothetical protein
MAFQDSTSETTETLQRVYTFLLSRRRQRLADSDAEHTSGEQDNRGDLVPDQTPSADYSQQATSAYKDAR